MIDLEQLPLSIRQDIEARRGQDEPSFLYMLPLWDKICGLQKDDSDAAWMMTSLYLVQFFGTTDPLPMHYLVAREILQTKDVTEDRGVDLLTRKLVTACQQFSRFLDRQRLDAASLVSETSGHNTMDWMLATFLEKNFSKTGKVAAHSLKEDSRARWQRCVDVEFSPSCRQLFWNTWINHHPQRAVSFSPYLLILADIVWEDCCATIWRKETQNVPALTQGVHPSVAKILSRRTQSKDIENTVHLLHETQIIARLPAIDPSLMQMVTKGIGKLNSLYHHKLIRFECRAGFENWATGKPDSRALRFERGCSEIAEHLNLHSNQAIETIKALLHAQAHLQFHFEDTSYGNLIILNKFRSSVSGREEGMMITLGHQLLPHYAFQTSKRNRLLIPVPELPPLVGSSNSHASQAALQMLIMQLFADKSIELAERGSITIEKNEWENMRRTAGLSHQLFQQTIDRWLNDGDDGDKVLIEIGVCRYALGPAYAKEQRFLIDQGTLRRKRQREGEKSYALKKSWQKGRFYGSSPPASP